MARFRALPYAKAMFQVIQDQAPGRTEEVADELDRVASALRAVPEFQRVMVTPMVPVETKSAILDEVLDSLEIKEPRADSCTWSNTIIGWSTCPTSRPRTASSSMIRSAAPGLGWKRQSDLDENERRRVIEAVAGVEGGSVVADFTTKSELLGGFKLQVGSRVFDGSLAGELNRLSKEIVIEQG